MTAIGAPVVAQRYARALLDVVLEHEADAAAVDKEISEFLALLESQPKLADALAMPTIAAEKRVEILNDVITRADLTPSTVNLLRLLTERERMPILNLVVEQYRRLLLEHERVQPGEVTSAWRLTEDQQMHLAKSLGAALGKTMVLEYGTDPELIGGLVVRVGNRVYDASVTSQLRRFKEKALSSF